jgi:hypothetical protein
LTEYADGYSKEILLAIIEDIGANSESASILGLLKAKK